MRFLAVLPLVLAALAPTLRADPIVLKSPNQQIVVTVTPGDHLKYSVSFQGKPAVEDSNLGIIIGSADLGKNAVAGSPETQEVNETYPVIGVHATATNHCMATTIPMTGGDDAKPWQLEFRVFNDGVAYRYVVADGSRNIQGESSQWVIPAATKLWFLHASNKSYEDRFHTGDTDTMPQKPGPDAKKNAQDPTEIMAPAALKYAAGFYGIMTEANLINYSDMSLKRSAANTFDAFFSNDATGWTSKTAVTSPWRVTILGADLNALVNSDIIKNLCPPAPPELATASWIKPGRSIWHWLTGGSPKLEQQKTWIDGASDMGYEYYLIDDGWRNWNGGGDAAWDAMKDLCQYAKTKNVSIWIWVGAGYIKKPEDRIAYFKRAHALGIVGVKADFPDAPNTEWVQWYEDTLKDGAANQLMLDFHGAVKPTGRERTWPNEINREAVAGREQGKNPVSHDAALPFIRYVQGHADYTPCLFEKGRLSGSSFAHELAQPIIFTAPYLCMGDNPKYYLASDALDVLKALPPVWDETIVLPGSEIGEQASYARRHGDQWFIGVLGGKPKADKIDLSFLPAGAKYKAIELSDDPARNDAFVRNARTVTNQDSLTFTLRSEGGYVAWLVPGEATDADKASPATAPAPAE